MIIYNQGYLYENVYNEHISQVDKEVSLTSMLSLGTDVLEGYFKSSSVIPVFRVLVLNEDESISYEISQDVISANLNITYQSGMRRTLDMVVSNADGYWEYGARKTLYEGMLFRLDCGAVINNTLYWQQQGVFILQEPSFSIDSSDNKINLTLCDKWGLWDGSVYGNTQLKTIVPQGELMRGVFDIFLHEDNGLGDMWDIRQCRFNSDYWNQNTYYTIKQDAGQTKSEIMLDLAKTISSDVYYSPNGHCVLENNILDFINNNFSVVWRFEEGDIDCSAPTLKYNRNNYHNKIIVKGNIVNGYQFSATTENKNKKSLYNVYDFPIMPKVIENSKLYSDNLCLEQSMKEMVDQSRGLLNVTMTTGYLPFLDVNMGLFLNFPSLGVNNQTYIIDSISYDIGTECTMNLSLSSNYDVTF